MGVILNIDHLTKDFYLHEQKKQIKSCSNISFQLQKGGFIGIVGTSGAGKSTVLRCIYRTYLATGGSVIYDSLAYGPLDLVTADERRIIHLRKAEIGYVSQFLSMLPRTTARQHVIDAALEAGFSQEEAARKAEEMLRYFRLSEELWELYPATFSGGEKLRLNLAHAMVKAPRLLLLDEPTASLDPDTKLLVRDLLLRLKEEGTSMLGIFHDLEFMDGLCDQVYNLSKGHFADKGGMS
ncbi:Glutamine transport ATP-binding protein GlnQ [uncultured Roseburia sp.]|uniref:ATP-binding cassette domain-containing protein n=1 Tax=Brotonthovivens ammoniilytica TaxID=2981725 RepID=A0ABT2TGU7_9FIRM|nr:ATP-binding cassette domain-containing protein [Brotonthovivens ammoniilytica]MCU6761419.1 ATP-binding cassette domain-containing protein [Brotonthovivens ammoniilytica]SCI27891.1 Glutamine transport ATP-binding protein GlnQ [uncultured Roseburia sp.]